MTIPDRLGARSVDHDDVVTKMRAYERSGVPQTWLIDPIAETLIVRRWTENGYLLVLDAQGEEQVNPKPLEAATFSVRGLLDGDDEEDSARASNRVAMPEAAILRRD